MTDKEFVQSIYPGAHFTRGNILNKQGAVLWQDEHWTWAKEWNDPVAIENAWNQLATLFKRNFLNKLES